VEWLKVKALSSRPSTAKKKKTHKNKQKTGAFLGQVFYFVEKSNIYENEKQSPQTKNRTKTN
jgi:hypothetical protein